MDFIYRGVELVLLQEGQISSVRNKHISKLKQGKGLFWLSLLIKEWKDKRWAGEGRSQFDFLFGFIFCFSGSMLGNPLPVPLCHERARGEILGLQITMEMVLTSTSNGQVIYNAQERNWPTSPKKQRGRTFIAVWKNYSVTILFFFSIGNGSSFRRMNYLLTSLPVSLWCQYPKVAHPLPCVLTMLGCRPSLPTWGLYVWERLSGGRTWLSFVSAWLAM